MPGDLRWSETARTDLLDIIGHISEDDPLAAQRLKDEVDAKLAKLLKHPRMYKVGRVAGTREMVVRANYIVVYALNAEAVLVLRVLHAARQWPPLKP